MDDYVLIRRELATLVTAHIGYSNDEHPLIQPRVAFAKDFESILPDASPLLHEPEDDIDVAHVLVAMMDLCRFLWSERAWEGHPVMRTWNVLAEFYRPWLIISEESLKAAEQEIYTAYRSPEFLDADDTTDYVLDAMNGVLTSEFPDRHHEPVRALRVRDATAEERRHWDRSVVLEAKVGDRPRWLAFPYEYETRPMGGASLKPREKDRPDPAGSLDTLFRASLRACLQHLEQFSPAERVRLNQFIAHKIEGKGLKRPAQRKEKKPAKRARTE